MKIVIARVEGKDIIGVSTDFSDIKHRGEISHVLVEMELIKHKLINLWNNFDNNNKT